MEMDAKTMLGHLSLFLRGVFGCVTITERCIFSRRFWDIHDYPITKGGDGTPSHFYTYTCWHCGTRFEI